jgi:hypothetical protein
VPTSIGYGANLGGVTAMLGMLTACANGMAVVNIDNGFGAASFAASILRGRDRKNKAEEKRCIRHKCNCRGHCTSHRTKPQVTMTIAYLDCFAGIAGDMTLAALLDCGVPLEALREGLSSLPVEGWDITAQPVLKSGIHGTSVSISLHGVTDVQELEASQVHNGHAHDGHVEHDETHNDHQVHSHEHHLHDEHEEHGHSHHEHSHEHHHHSHEHHHKHHHGRSMREIRDIIQDSGLSERVKQNSLAYSKRLRAWRRKCITARRRSAFSRNWRRRFAH